MNRRNRWILGWSVALATALILNITVGHRHWHHRYGHGHHGCGHYEQTCEGQQHDAVEQ